MSDDSDMRPAWESSSLRYVLDGDNDNDDGSDEQEEKELMSDLDRERKDLVHQLVTGSFTGRTNIVQDRLEEMIRDTRRQHTFVNRSLDGGAPLVDHHDFAPPRRRISDLRNSWTAGGRGGGGLSGSGTVLMDQDSFM